MVTKFKKIPDHNPVRLPDQVPVVILVFENQRYVPKTFYTSGLAYNGLTWHRRQIHRLGELTELPKAPWCISTHLGHLVKTQDNLHDKYALWKIFKALTVTDWSFLKEGDTEGFQRLITELYRAMENLTDED